MQKNILAMSKRRQTIETGKATIKHICNSAEATNRYALYMNTAIYRIDVKESFVIIY